MGWAARAKEQRGNPVPAAMSSRMRFISEDKHRRAFLPVGRPPTFARVAFSDREYLIDKCGTLRRAQRSVDGR